MRARILKVAKKAIAAGLFAAVAGVAHGSVSIIGGGLAEVCSKAALAERSDTDSIKSCDTALEFEDLDAHDRAGTLINRGVMKLRRNEFEPARSDFDGAIALQPSLGESWVNRGAAEVGERRYQAALDDINNALKLGVKEPEKAYFNRALAYEGLDDEKSAYLDYLQALTLKPGWALPEHELLRFTVSHK